MAFDSLGRYNPQHKTWDHVGNMIPVVEHSEGIRPHGEFRPSSWSPVQFYDKYYEDFFVIMPGKAVAFDNDGRICPAQYGLAAATVTYTSRDVDAGVIDVRTGLRLLAGDVGTFDVSAVTAFMGRTGVAMKVSAPVGVAPYAFWQWGGDGTSKDDGFNPAAFRKHNYQLQHRVAILCDYVLELPLVPAVHGAENMTQASYASNRAVFNALAHTPIAKNTMRTPIVFANGTLTDAATRFVVQKDTAAEVVAAGDWHINLETGVVTVYATGTLGVGNIYTVAYSNYGSAPTGSSVSKFACVLGDVKAGDFLMVNADSNYVKADPASVGFDQIMGQVLEVEDVLGKDALDRVRTAFPVLDTNALGTYPGYGGQMDQMPGSATGGVPDKVHYAGAANLVVRLNLISR